MKRMSLGYDRFPRKVNKNMNIQEEVLSPSDSKLKHLIVQPDALEIISYSSSLYSLLWMERYRKGNQT